VAGASFEKLGIVTSNDIIIDEENWGSIQTWKKTYNEALVAILKN
jgi:hypothetical protein